jgi:hypothetical protein
MSDAIDSFLAQLLRSIAGREATPPWPADWPSSPDFEDAVFARVAFHGTALAMLDSPTKLSDWPTRLRDRVLEEARSQTFWEMGHRQGLTRLVEALANAGFSSLITKGTALAYSVYPNPAVRRRGDSDLLLHGASRYAVRKILTANGFVSLGDPRPLQESWVIRCTMGFTHVFDLHWQVSASALLALCLERGGIGLRSVPLTRLCKDGRAIAPVDNLILIALNRASHRIFGYISGDAMVFDQGRLIWARDVDLLCRAFSAEDWQQLLTTVEASGTAPIILSALRAAEAALGTQVPEDVVEGLAQHRGDPQLLRYFGNLSGLERLRLEWAASPSARAKLRMAAYTLFPGDEVLHQRFPNAADWPIPALQARRLVAGIGHLFRKRN